MLWKEKNDLLSSYLVVNWYKIERIKTWDTQNSSSGITVSLIVRQCVSRAIGLFLKKIFLKFQFHNRPRQYFLLILFDWRLILNLMTDYELIIEGAKKPC